MTPLAVAAPRCESPCRHHAVLCRLVPPPRVAPRRCHLAVPPLAGIGRVAPCRLPSTSRGAARGCRHRHRRPAPPPFARFRLGRVDHHVQPHVEAADGVVGMRVVVDAVAAALRSACPPPPTMPIPPPRSPFAFPANATHTTAITANDADRRRENTAIRRHHPPRGPLLFLMSLYVSTS
jgi:hypothetical protein